MPLVAVRKTGFLVQPPKPDAFWWPCSVAGTCIAAVRQVMASGNATIPPSPFQVCQFVFSVNGVYVLHLDYPTISSLIMTGPRTLVMEVMEAVEWAENCLLLISASRNSSQRVPKSPLCPALSWVSKLCRGARVETHASARHVILGISK